MGKTRLLFVGVALAAGLIPLCVRSVASAENQHRIPAADTAQTERDVTRARHEFLLRNGPEAYRKVGMRGPSWDEDAIRMLATFAEWRTDPRLPAPTSMFLSLGQTLMKRGCNDPLVLYCYGYALLESQRPLDAEPVLRRAVDGFGQSEYPRICAADAANRMAAVLKQVAGETDQDRAHYLDLSIRYLGESLTDGSFRPSELGLFLDMLDYSSWAAILEGRELDLYQALQRDEKADPYAVMVVGGRYHIAAGWQARGSNWGSEVSEQGWEEFDAHLRAARKLLTEAWKMRPDLPYAPTEMITVVGAGGGANGETERLWFDRSVAAQLDHQWAYETLLWFMRPRWSGSHEEMYQFGLACLQTGRFDTTVPMYFVVAVYNITDDLDGSPTYWEKPETYEHLQALFDGYARAENRPAPTTFYDTVHAAAAYRCGHEDVAKELLRKLGDKLEVSAFTYYAGVDVAQARHELGIVSSSTTSAATTVQNAGTPRRVLFSFLPRTPAEEECIYLNRGADRGVESQARIAAIHQKMIYRFTIPPDVTGADFIVEGWGNFAVDVARDAGGGPGEFHEELNTIKLFGRKVYDSRPGYYGIDLTPYIDSPSRTVYVAIHAADPTTGWAWAVWRRIEVAALDDTERANLARLGRRVDALVWEERARHPFDLRTNSNEAEAPYLYRDQGSELQPPARIVNGAAEVIYRIPLKQEYAGASLLVYTLGDFLVSYALEDHGRPGRFADVLRARDVHTDQVIEEHGGVPPVPIDILEAMLDSPAIYVRIRDGAPDKPGGVEIHTLSIVQ